MPYFQDARHYPNGVSDDQYNELKKEADNVTRLLCSVMRVLDKHDNIVVINQKIIDIDGLSEWWKKHKVIDQKRIEKEVQEVLKNLSPEAKELLAQQLQK